MTPLCYAREKQGTTTVWIGQAQVGLGTTRNVFGQSCEYIALAVFQDKLEQCEKVDVTIDHSRSTLKADPWDADAVVALDDIFPGTS